MQFYRRVISRKRSISRKSRPCLNTWVVNRARCNNSGRYVRVIPSPSRRNTRETRGAHVKRKNKATRNGRRDVSGMQMRCNSTASINIAREMNRNVRIPRENVLGWKELAWQTTSNVTTSRPTICGFRRNGPRVHSWIYARLLELSSDCLLYE